MVGFGFILACAAGFILFSSADLPAVVASHFDGSGAANGYMPKPMYLGIMLVIGLGVPLVLAVAPQATMGRNDERLNLPNKTYWLDPRRRDDTINFLKFQARLFAVGLTFFLCYVHWLVVRANFLVPARLASSEMIAALVILAAALLLWLGTLYAHFRRRP